MGERLLAMVTAADAHDPCSLSGTPHFMLRALERRGFEVDCLGPASPPSHKAGLLLNAVSKRVAGKRFAAKHSLALSRGYARVFGRRLDERPYDAVIAPFASTEIARLKTRLPIVYLSDLTFDLALDFYPAFSGLLRRSRRQGEEIERSAVQRASLLVYPTCWAARSALERYGAQPGKVHVIPFGANIEDPPAREEVLPRLPGEAPRLLFVGVDWERKGGPIALQALRELRRSGLRAELTVLGCSPPGLEEEEGVRVIPFLDKKDPRQLAEFRRLYREHDFLLLPTRKEAYGIVFCEAAAFGLPVVSTEAGGVPELVRQGDNGYLLPPTASGAEYARVIEELFGDAGLYASLCEKSRVLFEERLNWDAWGERMACLLEELMSR